MIRPPMADVFEEFDVDHGDKLASKIVKANNTPKLEEYKCLKFVLSYEYDAVHDMFMMMHNPVMPYMAVKNLALLVACGARKM